MSELSVPQPVTTNISLPSPEEPPVPITKNASNEAIPIEDDAYLLPHPQQQPSRAEGERDKKNKKRKRTSSPEDHNILEQEYKRDPKPNKESRMQIVEKVKLTEKEVQIWFQNRRQSSRRKSRPLLPHEVVAFGLGDMAVLSSDSMSSSLHVGCSSMSSEAPSRSHVSAVVVPAVEAQKGRSSPLQKDVRLKEDSACLAEVDRVSPQQPNSVDDRLGLDGSAQPNMHESITFDMTPQTQLASPPDHQPGSSNRASSPGISTTHTPFSPQLEALSSCSENCVSMDSKIPSSSRMRLSLSLEGRAELQEVSPPRITHFSSFDLSATPRRPSGLQRSQSALPLGFSSRKHLASYRTVRPPTGRSRDARAWEFYADNGIHSELSLPFEHHDSSGSAAVAISLMRSIRSGSNNALTLNQNKRNATVSKAKDGTAVKKSKLGRSSSSLPRLQGSHTADTLKPQKSRQPSMLCGSPMGDSDKENWISGENGSEIRTTASTKAQGYKQDKRRVLGENATLTSKPVARRSRKRESEGESTSIFEEVVIDENFHPGVDIFMRGTLSPSKRGDLDCVQGLLSLSQGNWR